MRARLPRTPAILPSVENVIHTIRGERVILDADLARLYGVPTKALNQAVRRNRAKFPPDFLFQLTSVETELVADLRSKIVISSRIKTSTMRSQIVTASKRNTRHTPFAFTEHGAIMAANILNSPQAVQMSVFVVRAFVKMRGLLTDTRELARKLAALEQELTARLDTHEAAITELMRRIMLLLDPPPDPPEPAREMGFHTTLQKPR